MGFHTYEEYREYLDGSDENIVSHHIQMAREDGDDDGAAYWSSVRDYMMENSVDLKEAKEKLEMNEFANDVLVQADENKKAKKSKMKLEAMSDDELLAIIETEHAKQDKARKAATAARERERKSQERENAAKDILKKRQGEEALKLLDYIRQSGWTAPNGDVPIVDFVKAQIEKS